MQTRRSCARILQKTNSPHVTISTWESLLMYKPRTEVRAVYRNKLTHSEHRDIEIILIIIDNYVMPLRNRNRTLVSI